MSSRRCHIIYAHPAASDGYAFFYLYYWPGDRQLALKYRQGSGEVKEVSLAPVAMLDLIENQAALPSADRITVRPWERAAKALRLRIQTWMERAREEREAQ